MKPICIVNECSLISIKKGYCNKHYLKQYRYGNPLHSFEQTGKSKTPEHNAWSTMMKRCFNSNSEKYPRYGGRGITVCERWKKFKYFLQDMGQKPTPNHSIDRIDNNGNYEPSNCRWATLKQQANNKSTNVPVVPCMNNCGKLIKSFLSHGKKRRYCSHSCYIKHRFNIDPQ